MNLAIISPNKDVYSETFIRAHLNIPGLAVLFYYNGTLPTMLDGKGKLESYTIYDRLNRRLHRMFRLDQPSVKELEFLKSLKKEKINCVLAEYGYTGVDVLNVCKKLKVPLVVHFHGWDASRNDLIDKYASGYKKMFQYASAVIAVSRVMEKKLLALGCPEQKLVYNPYGPDEAFFNVRPDFKTKLFLGIGRFVDKKAPYYTLLAFHQVVKQYPDTRLILAGDGPLWNTCVNLSRYLNIEDKIVFPGVITPEQFRNYLQEASAFVQHSVTSENGDMEGTPVGVLEASAAGLPVISTNHAGIPDVIIHGETGLLVEEHDVDGMAENMVWILNHSDAARQMGMKGRARVKENFSLDKHLTQLQKVIQEAINVRIPVIPKDSSKPF